MKNIRTCLLIDDDVDDHEIFSMALEDAGISIDLVSEYSASSALDRLDSAERLPDIIFLDLNMPKIGGKQCLAEIRKKEHLKQIPVIIYSTSADIRDLIETRELGASAYVVKSSRLEDLIAALNDCLSELK